MVNSTITITMVFFIIWLWHLFKPQSRTVPPIFSTWPNSSAAALWDVFAAEGYCTLYCIAVVNFTSSLTTGMRALLRCNTALNSIGCNPGPHSSASRWCTKDQTIMGMPTLQAHPSLHPQFSASLFIFLSRTPTQCLLIFVLLIKHFWSIAATFFSHSAQCQSVTTVTLDHYYIYSIDETENNTRNVLQLTQLNAIAIAFN